ncbi:hypothetical protein [Longimicrobium sp.]|uniref:hypothetical protein n=1 Tax=Longimicrobium sp. TaxID=2029185 RepID=UPI002CFB0984|nr:hypothetical protein [Longimicrobium sp.]HSU17201.1 hypothetical protein [Longimicrobium sp.]
MDRIDLPLIAGDPSLAEVFGRMASTGVHAVIVAAPGREPVLVTNLDVDEGIEQGLDRVDQISSFPLHVVNAEVEDWQAVLDEAGSSYGIDVAGWRGGDDAEDKGDDGDVVASPTLAPRDLDAMVTIVTRHETLAHDIRSSGEVCRCRNLHRAPKGRPCPICSTRVRCA